MRGSQIPSGHLRGPGFEVVNNLLKVTLSSAFLENGSLDVWISKVPLGAPSS